ncbi:SRPBCC family protein [Streptomyces coelicoflavus]|uniref:SRPBCC family protein n=1 Tax=Streptomyces coelicoflavus TaxID=285562 RepID=UPI0036628387
MSPFSTSLSTTTPINAAPADVWRVLTDLPGYRDWNPYYRDAEGEVAEGQVVRLHAQLPGGRAAVSRCRVVRVDPVGELSWSSRLSVPGLMDTVHRFRLDRAVSGVTVLEQHETLRGVLVPLSGSVVHQIRNGCTAMGEALRQRVET